MTPDQASDPPRAAHKHSLALNFTPRSVDDRHLGGSVTTSTASATGDEADASITWSIRSPTTHDPSNGSGADETHRLLIEFVAEENRGKIAAFSVAQGGINPVAE